MRDRLSQVHWRLVLGVAVLVYIATLILGVALSSLLLAVFSRSDSNSQSAVQASSLISALLVIVVTGYGAFWVARRVKHAALLHAILVGLVVALISFLLDWLFIRSVEPAGLLLYALMVASGLLGGMLGGRRREQS